MTRYARMFIVCSSKLSRFGLEMAVSVRVFECRASSVGYGAWTSRGLLPFGLGRGRGEMYSTLHCHAMHHAPRDHTTTSPHHPDSCLAITHHLTTPPHASSSHYHHTTRTPLSPSTETPLPPHHHGSNVYLTSKLPSVAHTFTFTFAFDTCKIIQCM